MLIQHDCDSGSISNDPLLLGVKVGVYGIARAGFPKGGPRLREERV